VSKREESTAPRAEMQIEAFPLIPDEQAWLCGDAFPDQVFWLPDEEAARLWGERYRSGSLDDEELKIHLDIIAYLHPGEAAACLHWLAEEHAQDPGWRYTFPDRREVTWPEFLRYLQERAGAGQRIRDLAAAPAEERRVREQAVRRISAEHPAWFDAVRDLVLAEALVDPHHAAELSLEFWCRQTSWYPIGEGEVARRLWMRDPDTALSYMDRQERRHCASLLPILLQRTLTLPSKANRRLALELMERLPWCSWTSAYISLMRVRNALERWPATDHIAFIEAAAEVMAQFDPDHALVRHGLHSVNEEFVRLIQILSLPRTVKRSLTRMLARAKDRKPLR
jgi:hypothetical protein